MYGLVKEGARKMCWGEKNARRKNKEIECHYSGVNLFISFFLKRFAFSFPFFEGGGKGWVFITTKSISRSLAFSSFFLSNWLVLHPFSPTPSPHSPFLFRVRRGCDGVRTDRQGMVSRMNEG